MRQNIKTDRQIPVRSIPRLSGMGKYLAFFRLHFTMGLQYRTAAFAGIATQFVWGAMEILMFRAFYQTPDNGSFPMTFEATCAYVWMQQAFLALFMAWMMDNDIFTCIMDGNVSYELCRPIDLYNMWFSRSLASRCSKAVLRCMPILLVAAFLPKPYGLMAPVDAAAFLLFLLTLATGLAVTVAFCMLIYISAFSPCRRTVSAWSPCPWWNFSPARSYRCLFSLTASGDLWNCCPSPPCRMSPCGFTAAIYRAAPWCAPYWCNSFGCSYWWRQEKS